MKGWVRNPTLGKHIQRSQQEAQRLSLQKAAVKQSRPPIAMSLLISVISLRERIWLVHFWSSIIMAGPIICGHRMMGWWSKLGHWGLRGHLLWTKQHHPPQSQMVDQRVNQGNPQGWSKAVLHSGLGGGQLELPLLDPGPKKFGIHNLRRQQGANRSTQHTWNISSEAQGTWSRS